MIIITRSQTIKGKGIRERATFPDDQWQTAKEYEKSQRAFARKHIGRIPHVISIEFKLGYPKGYGLYKGAGCVLPGHEPEDVFPIYSTTPFERGIYTE